MEFSIVAEFWIIEESYKAYNFPDACFPVAEILSPAFRCQAFQIPDGFD